MATDIIFTTELIDAAIAELKANLPAAMLTQTAGEAALKLLEHGDLSDYAGRENVLLANTPAIIIRPLGIAPDGGGTGGVERQENGFRLVHIRRHEDCYDDAGNREDNMTRARGRYLKIIAKALLHDPRRALNAATLTSADTAGAQIIPAMTWDGVDYGIGMGGNEDIRAIRKWAAKVWAVSLDFTVPVRCGG
jgi:hypothetical protein